LTAKVNEILKKADIKIEDKFEATRLGKTNAETSGNEARLRPVKVCLRNHWDKRVIYRARTSMMATKNVGIFINEDLPKIQQTLLMHCRKARRGNKLTTCWTEDGVVHIKTKDKDDIVITDLGQLKKETGYTE
jgi:hypothetical protein